MFFIYFLVYGTVFVAFAVFANSDFVESIFESLSNDH